MPRLFVCLGVVLLLPLLLAGCGSVKSTLVQTPLFELTVAAPAPGAGSVTSHPAGIHCPGTCTASFPLNTQVQLTATPGNDYFFEGWGGSCSGSNACSLTMTVPEQVSATFILGERLTVATSGSGTGTVTSSPAGISCPATCSATFPQDTQVTLTATPGTNDVFSSWSGACSGTASCTVTVSAANSVTANFAAASTGGGGGNGGGGSTTAAWVYVSSNDGNTSQIVGFSADSNGQLTPLSASPFAFGVSGLAVTKNYLFGTDGVNVDSFAIAPDGSISEVSSLNAVQYNGDGQCGGGPYALFSDLTGETLYDVDGNSCANIAYQSFSINDSTGGLTFLAITEAQSPVLSSPLSFIGNDQYAYSANCYHFLPNIFGFTRSADGTLALHGSLANNPPIPAAPSGNYYCPYLAAADPSSDVVIPVTPLDIGSQQVTGPTQLAVYTADEQGNLTTTSTSANMPATAVNSNDSFGVTAVSISPSGMFLAVAGPLGLQIFQMNGSNPPTQLTGLLVNQEIDELGWDGNNHLYAAGTTAGKLFVFTVSASGASPTPSSPYAVVGPISLAVMPQP